MLDIEYKGANAVVLSTKSTTVYVDPKLSAAGGKDIDVKNNVEIATEDRFATDAQEAKLVIKYPGDYEVSDFAISGVAATRHIDTESDRKVSTIYRVEVGDVRVGILGNIAPKLSEDQLEGLGVVDILILPVGGGGYTLDATSACALVRQIEPKVVIPVHYADDTLKYEVPQDSLNTFVQELGAQTEQSAKYRVKSSASLPTVLTVIELARTA